MTGKLNRHAYETLITGDLTWLEALPPTLERNHVIQIVTASADHEYGPAVAGKTDHGARDTIINGNLWRLHDSLCESLRPLLGTTPGKCNCEELCESRRRPSDFSIQVPPFVGTLGSSELEHTASLMVRACQVLGDKWQPLTLHQLIEVFRADIDGKVEPLASLSQNPFFRPTFFHLMVERGFARWVGEPGLNTSGLELTWSAIALLQEWTRP